MTNTCAKGIWAWAILSYGGGKATKGATSWLRLGRARMWWPRSWSQGHTSSWTKRGSLYQRVEHRTAMSILTLEFKRFMFSCTVCTKILWMNAWTNEIFQRVIYFSIGQNLDVRREYQLWPIIVDTPSGASRGDPPQVPKNWTIFSFKVCLTRSSSKGTSNPLRAERWRAWEHLHPQAMVTLLTPSPSRQSRSPQQKTKWGSKGIPSTKVSRYSQIS